MKRCLENQNFVVGTPKKMECTIKSRVLLRSRSKFDTHNNMKNDDSIMLKQMNYRNFQCLVLYEEK